ncbi:MAG: hypothetical protein IJK89_12775 [Clostridia bacterium]|nr:hypothetical protein [Clostridia bacterium]
MKKVISITALLCAAALLLFGCGCGKKTPKEPAKADEVVWIDGSLKDLHWRYPDSMYERSFVPREDADGDAYGITDDEGRFFGFSVEIMAYEPGDFDELGPDGFLRQYFPEHAAEYQVTEVGDEENGNEIARYNGNPVFARATEDLSAADGDFRNAAYMTEYLILDEGNNRSFVYIVSVYDNDACYPGTSDSFGWEFRHSLSFDNDTAKADDLVNEDNAMLEAEGAVFEPVELYMGNYPQYEIQGYHLTVVGAEFFRHDGKEAIRVICDVENTDTDKDRVWQAYEYFRLTASQDGEELTKTWEYEAYEKDAGYDGTNPEVLIDMANYIYDNEYSNNRRCMIRNGHTVRTAEEFLCDWQGGPVTLRITLPIYEYNLNFYDENDPLITELAQNCVKEVAFDPADMPCKVKNSAWLTPAKEPAWTSGLPEEGDISPDDPQKAGRIRLADAEFVEKNDGTHMLLHMAYTNRGDRENSVFELLAIPVWKSGMADGKPHLWVMQDGVSLLLVETEQTKHGQDQLVKPGETAEYVLEYIVRSDSPVEVEVNYMTSDGEFAGKAAGKVYKR